MLTLHEDLGAAKTPAPRTVIQRLIDQLVYELYGSGEGIKIVEAV